MVTIRFEIRSDYETVQKVNQLAFGRPDEAALVNALRSQAAPYVSLIAERELEIIGHIFFSPVSIENSGPIQLAFGLAPMAVTPEHQRRGVGSLLVTEGLKECKRLGGDLVVVVGHSHYYPRFGFRPAVQFGLTCEYEVAPEEFMVKELHQGALTGVQGLVKYHKVFGGFS